MQTMKALQRIPRAFKELARLSCLLSTIEVTNAAQNGQSEFKSTRLTEELEVEKRWISSHSMTESRVSQYRHHDTGHDTTDDNDPDTDFE